jgi:hypothetical protein
MPLNYDALTALTQKKYIPKVVDNFYKSNPFLVYLKKKKSTFPGGHKIVEPLVYGNVTGIKSYSLYDTITYDTDIPISAAEFEPKNIVAPIIISKDEELKNSGETQVLSMLQSKIEIVEKTLKEQVTSMLYGDGTGNLGKDIDGLGAAISDSNTYGGIDRATYAWWKAKIATNNPGTPGTPAALDLNNMVRTFLAISDGNDQPDLLLCGLATWHEYYKAVEAKTQLQTTMGKKMADYGFQTLEFMGKPIIADPNCPEGSIYFLNSKYMKWRVHKNANFATTKFRPDDTRLAKKQEILLTANLTINNARRFARLDDIDYTSL